MPDPNIQTVQMAPKGMYETVVDMLVKQGPIAILLAIAVWFLWSAGEKANERHAAELAGVRAEAKSEMDRLERVLSGRVSVVEEKASTNAEKNAVVEEKVIAASAKADVAEKKAAVIEEKVKNLMP